MRSFAKIVSTPCQTALPSGYAGNGILIDSGINMSTHTKTGCYALAQQYADLTKGLIRSGNSIRLQKCLRIAEQLFKKGSPETKNAITNVYLYAVTTCMEIHHFNPHQVLPEQLHAEYIKQINTPGI